MIQRLGKVFAACIAAVVLLSAVGCSDEKSPTRTINDKDVRKDEGKPGAR
jgi:hypothetical protein